jgi:hypothetical protein
VSPESFLQREVSDHGVRIKGLEVGVWANDPKNPGIGVRVDRLEQGWSLLTRLIWAVLFAGLACFGGIITILVTKH